MRQTVLAGIALMLTGMNAFSDEMQTYAERLGWPKGSKVIIFHCDDAGMSHSSNMGAIESIQKGLVTSVSTMMPCGWVPEWARILKETPGIDNGLHITLNAEWDNYRWTPVAGRDAVPGLADEMGCLWDNVSQVEEHATADEVEKEIRAQIARAEAMGMPITHIDSHMGALFCRQDIMERYLKIGMGRRW